MPCISVADFIDRLAALLIHNRAVLLLLFSF